MFKSDKISEPFAGRRIRQILTLTSCLSIASLTGCKKEVQVGVPITQLVTTSVFDNDNTATAASLSVYAQMSAYPVTIHRLTALSSDELTNYATDKTSLDLYKNSLNAISDGNPSGSWINPYKYIYQVNAILEGLQSSKSVSAPVKKQLTGEAFFMRAYFYFHLINLYGDVPLVTSTNYKINAIKPRTPTAQVYQQIINDLKTSQGLLNSNYVDATDTAITTDHLRPTTWAATALLARAYLYTAKYDSAETQATKVISNTTYSLPTDLTQIFKMNSSEAIWQITPVSTQFWTQDGSTFILSTAPSSAGNNSTTISPQLYNAFEPGDNRKTTWINSYSKNGSTWYFPYKYRDNNKANVLNEYTMVLRLAEQYLIRAEARAQQGNTDGALADLNAIRNRAGLANYSGLTDKASLLTAIAHERQVELFTEGDRWFDLKRTKTVDAVMGGTTGATAAKGGVWNTNQQLYPIYLQDIQNNSNLTQNPGY